MRVFRHKLGRLIELFKSPLYRKVVFSRFLCGCLARLNPDIKYIGLQSGDIQTFLFLKDNAVTPYSIATGGFQKSEVQELISFCHELKIPLGGKFVDVGANIGTSTIFALKSGQFSTAIALEPIPENLALARLNISSNLLENRVKLLSNAASNKNGIFQMELSGANCGDHRLGSHPTAATGKFLNIEARILDDVIAEQVSSLKEISLVWMDTQGHEGFVLEGSLKLIRAGIPFSIEFRPMALKEAGCFETLLKIIECEFCGFIELGTGKKLHFNDVKEIRSFAKRFENTILHTDLLLVPKLFA